LQHFLVAKKCLPRANEAKQISKLEGKDKSVKRWIEAGEKEIKNLEITKIRFVRHAFLLAVDLKVFVGPWKLQT